MVVDGVRKLNVWELKVGIMKFHFFKAECHFKAERQDHDKLKLIVKVMT
jgi:hypothetical protein